MAIARLFLSHAFRRQIFGNTRYSVVSRFVDEIPKEYVETSGTQIKFTEYKSQAVSCESHDYDFDQRPPEERAGAFARGTRVSHPVFGMGFIKRCEATASGHKVTVQFKNGALKRLIAERAGLVSL